MISQQEKSPNYRHVKTDRKPHVITVFADHTRSRRISRGAEISRNITRGQPPIKMEENLTMSWGVLLDGRRIATVQVAPNGHPSSGRELFIGKSATEAGVTMAEAEILRIERARAMAAEKAQKDPGPSPQG